MYFKIMVIISIVLHKCNSKVLFQFNTLEPPGTKAKVHSIEGRVKYYSKPYSNNNLIDKIYFENDYYDEEWYDGNHFQTTPLKEHRTTTTKPNPDRIIFDWHPNEGNSYYTKKKFNREYIKINGDFDIDKWFAENYPLNDDHAASYSQKTYGYNNKYPFNVVNFDTVTTEAPPLTTTPKVMGMGTPPSDCEKSCKTAMPYSPVCGSNGQTFYNVYRFNCAVRCGKDITIKHYSACDRVPPRG